MASLLLGGPPRDAEGNPKKMPKVAVYVAGATFAITTGLTLLILPYVRQAARMTAAPQFLSNRHIIRKDLHSTLAQSEMAVELETARAKGFNDREERSLYGSLEGEGEQVSPWLGAQALGVATAVVFGSAGLGAWVIAKLLGVKDMNEFSSKMREQLQVQMPALAEALHAPESHEQVEERAGVEEWVRRFQAEEAERERKV